MNIPASFADVRGDSGSKLVRPATDGLVSDIDATLGDQILDIPQAHRETIVEPHRISDHIRREPVPLEADLSHSPRLTNGERFALD